MSLGMSTASIWIVIYKYCFSLKRTRIIWKKKCLIPCLRHKMYKKSLKYLVLEMRKFGGSPWWYSGGDFHCCGLDSIPCQGTKNSQAMLGTWGGVRTLNPTVETNLLYATIWELERQVTTMNWKTWDKSYTTIFKTIRTTKYFDQLQRMPGNYFIVLIIGKRRHISTLCLSYFYCTNYTSQ